MEDLILRMLLFVERFACLPQFDILHIVLFVQGEVCVTNFTIGMVRRRLDPWGCELKIKRGIRGQLRSICSQSTGEGMKVASFTTVSLLLFHYIYPPISLPQRRLLPALCFR